MKKKPAGKRVSPKRRGDSADTRVVRSPRGRQQRTRTLSSNKRSSGETFVDRRSTELFRLRKLQPGGGESGSRPSALGGARHPPGFRGLDERGAPSAPGRRRNWGRAGQWASAPVTTTTGGSGARTRRTRAVRQRRRRAPGLARWARSRDRVHRRPAHRRGSAGHADSRRGTAAADSLEAGIAARRHPAGRRSSPRDGGHRDVWPRERRSTGSAPRRASGLESGPAAPGASSGKAAASRRPVRDRRGEKPRRAPGTGNPDSEMAAVASAPKPGPAP